MRRSSRDHPGGVRRVAIDGMLFALAMALSAAEGILPIPAPMPGIRLGLANIVVMYAVFFVGRWDALTLAMLKGLFALLTRGAVAGALSLAGSLLSVLIMIMLIAIFGKHISYFMLSVAGALAHNAGQLIVVKLIYASLAAAAFVPILTMSGIAAGFVTAGILRAFMPAAKRMGFIARR
ncbi:hypothetical protein AGMMS49992_05710 [Clostridia bacterium]|nr:hypothetical protein AGMMS49992_05710 [Clostridia bacterium]